MIDDHRPETQPACPTGLVDAVVMELVIIGAWLSMAGYDWLVDYGWNDKLSQSWLVVMVGMGQYILVEDV